MQNRVRQYCCILNHVGTLFLMSYMAMSAKGASLKLPSRTLLKKKKKNLMEFHLKKKIQPG